MQPPDAQPEPRPISRLLVVAPSWVGDAVMATPALRALRDRLPGAFIAALVKPGVDEIYAGAGFFDEVLVDTRDGVMGAKRAARKVRPLRCDAALLLTNSFSTALIARLAGIPRRIGTDRDARGALLTEGIKPERVGEVEPYAGRARARRDRRKWAPVPACELYMRLARFALGEPELPMGALLLRTTPAQEERAALVLERTGARADEPFALLCPGGVNKAKRWPADRFAKIARRLTDERGLGVLVTGSPAERGLAAEIVARAGDPRVRDLAAAGVDLGALKAIARRASVTLTNDTGPRHIAAAFSTPVVTIFGPTDPRWTTIPFDGERIVVADPALPDGEIADDHPRRCAVDHVQIGAVWEAIASLLEGAAVTPPPPRRLRR